MFVRLPMSVVQVRELRRRKGQGLVDGLAVVHLVWSLKPERLPSSAVALLSKMESEAPKGPHGDGLRWHQETQLRLDDQVQQ